MLFANKIISAHLLMDFLHAGKWPWDQSGCLHGQGLERGNMFRRKGNGGLKIHVQLRAKQPFQTGSNNNLHFNVCME